MPARGWGTNSGNLLTSTSASAAHEGRQSSRSCRWSEDGAGPRRATPRNPAATPPNQCRSEGRSSLHQGGVSVFVDEAAEDAGAERSAGVEVARYAFIRGTRAAVLRVSISSPSKNGVEGGGVLVLSVAEQEAQRVEARAEFGGEIPGLLHCPVPGGVGGDAGDVQALVACSRKASA
jgi:hypothetical protein